MKKRIWSVGWIAAFCLLLSAGCGPCSSQGAAGAEGKIFCPAQGYPQTERPGVRAAAAKHFCPNLGYPQTADRAGETGADPQAGKTDVLPPPASVRGTKTVRSEPAVTVRKSKGKLKKAAGKSRTVTRKITRRRKQSSVSDGFVVLRETTTVRKRTTVYKKGSRVTDITVRVSRSVRTTATPVHAEEADIRRAAAEADARLLQRFTDEGYRYVIDTGLAYTGLFSSRNRQITMRCQNDVVYHELGHYLAYTTGNTDLTPWWADVFEKEAPYFDGENKDYVTSTCREYFAETYRDYVTRPSRLRRTRPQSYACMEKVLSML